MTSFFRDKWLALKKGPCTGEELKRLSRQIAYSFLDSYLKDCRYEDEYIDLLCEMTTFSDDSELTNPGARALFGIIVESLCDDFEELQTLTYNRVMSQVISYCRSIPAGKKLDLKLRSFGIRSQSDLLRRMQKVRVDGDNISLKGSVRKVILLSRVTIGADVAVTSVVIQRLAKAFPEAEIVLVGEKKLGEIYGGHPDIRIRSVPYSKKGGLLERLSTWLLVLEIIEEETTHLPLENTILVDPDSRLSQLGVLPIVSMENYLFFDSRSDKSYESKMSMAELANSWLDKVCGQEAFCYPQVWLPQSNIDTADRFCKRLRDKGARHIIVLNLGVGENPRKRVGVEFEKKLLLTLLKSPNTVILLDKGFGDEELGRTNALIDWIQGQGFFAAHSSFSSEDCGALGHGVIGIQTRIGEIAALISRCDEFIGYDSACQHISAALGTPCVTVFAGSNNMRFIRRWSAFGRGSSRIVHVDTLSDPEAIDLDDIITRVMHMRHMNWL